MYIGDNCRVTSHYSWNSRGILNVLTKSGMKCVKLGCSLVWYKGKKISTNPSSGEKKYANFDCVKKSRRHAMKDNIDMPSVMSKC
jgi:hypothetical protein